MYFQLLQPTEIPWADLDSFPDRNLFQTKPWLDFVAACQNAVPVVAALHDSGQILGYFTGLVIRRLGLRILGSPMPGWTTPYMGFNLAPGVPRWQAMQALREFAFGELHCVHLEITDRYVTEADAQRARFLTFVKVTYLTDLTPPISTIFHNLHRSPQRGIRKAQASGVTIEQAFDAEFADDLYPQLKDVFAKHRLAPTYDIERVRQLIRYLLPTGHLLLLRARDADGRCIASCIYEGMGEVAYGFANGSYRAYQHLCPNQALHWHALKYWKERGAKVFDWVGGGQYKESYGATQANNVWCRASRIAALEKLRNVARAGHRVQQLAAGALFHTSTTQQMPH